MPTNRQSAAPRKLYRLMNLGVGETNEGKYGVLGSPFAICDDCLPLYDPTVTNNIDTRLVGEVPGTTDEPCSHYSHQDKPNA